MNETTTGENDRPTVQLCLRCGRHEQLGSYCTFCRTAEYDLVDHAHTKHAACLLGAHLDPLPDGHPALPWMVRRFLAEPHKAIPAAAPNRRHHRYPSYAAQSDPEIPSWVPLRRASDGLQRVAGREVA